MVVHEQRTTAAPVVATAVKTCFSFYLCTRPPALGFHLDRWGAPPPLVISAEIDPWSSRYGSETQRLAGDDEIWLTVAQHFTGRKPRQAGCVQRTICLLLTERFAQPYEPAASLHGLRRTVVK